MERTNEKAKRQVRIQLLKPLGLSGALWGILLISLLHVMTRPDQFVFLNQVLICLLASTTVTIFLLLTILWFTRNAQVTQVGPSTWCLQKNIPEE
jgi:hypothetical protein